MLIWRADQEGYGLGIRPEPRASLHHPDSSLLAYSFTARNTGVIPGCERISQG